MNIAARDNFNLIYNGIYDVLKSDKNSALLSNGAKITYSHLYSWYKSTNHIGNDGFGEYIRVTREVIAGLVGVSIKTVIGYIKELHRAGLIKDVRIGFQEVNKIFFYDVDEKYKYTPGNKKSKPQNASNDKASTTKNVEPEKTQEKNGLIAMVKQDIMDRYDETITTKNCKQILMVADSNVEIIRMALKYMGGKSYDNFVAKLTDTIRNRYWEKVKPSKDIPPQIGAVEGRPKSPPNKSKPNNKGRFTNISSHDWNMGKLEKIEQAYILKESRQISEEEYHLLIKEIEESDN